MESPRKMSVQKRPTARQIQPTGFLGCLEVIRAPTMGKARKERKINSSLRVSPVLVGSCDEWARTCSTMLARGCYELAQKRLTNAENWRPTENRTNGDIRISMRFPAEFITRSREALTQRESGSFFTP